MAAREAQLAARRGRPEDAAAALRRVGVMPCPTVWPVATAVEAMTEAGYEAAAVAVLGELLDDEDAQPDVGGQWVRLRTAQGDWSCAERLPQLVARVTSGCRLPTPTSKPW